MSKLSTKEDIAVYGTDPIPAAPYYDPAYVALEREAVFKKSWLALGRAAELPNAGDFIVREIEVAKTSVLLIRGKDMQIRAFYNVCPHRGTQLVSQSEGNKSAVACPYHSWTFNLDGSLRAIPGKNNFFDIERQNCNLVPIHLGEAGGFLFVCLSEPEQTLDEFLGEAGVLLSARDTESYDVFAEMDNVVAANWKTAQDNFQEVYHLTTIHRSTLVPMATSPSNPAGDPWYEVYGPHRRMRQWRNFSFTPPTLSGVKLPTKADPAGDNAEGGDGLDVLTLFPNTHVNHDLGRYFTHQFWPIDEGHTRLVGRIYLRKAKTARERVIQEFTVSYTRDVWAEDWPIILALQKGIQSGALRQIHFQKHELMCRQGFNAVSERVEKYRANIDKAQV